MGWQMERSSSAVYTQLSSLQAHSSAVLRDLDSARDNTASMVFEISRQRDRVSQDIATNQVRGLLPY